MEVVRKEINDRLVEAGRPHPLPCVCEECWLWGEARRAPLIDGQTPDAPEKT